MQPPSGAALSFDIIGTDGENAEKTRCERAFAGKPEAGPVQASVPASPREGYPEILQGPERTNVKSAHVTHFYPKYITADHPIVFGSPPHHHHHHPPPLFLPGRRKTAQSPGRRGAYGREAEEVGVDS